MGFANRAELIDAIVRQGQSYQYSWRKLSSIGTSFGGTWFDLSLTPGNPSPQYYASTPLVGVLMKQSTDGGIPHGQAVAPLKKYLQKSLIFSPGNANGVQLMLLDYLMFYPFLDEGTTDIQPVTTPTPLSRYSDGKDVKIMAVSVGGRTGLSRFRISYTNQAGVSGRITPWIRESNASQINGLVVSSGAGTTDFSGCFCPLQQGDSGVRSIESFEMETADVGLVTLVLVKPIMTTQILEQTAAVEVDFLRDFAELPEIEDDAYLNYVVQSSLNLGSVGLFGINTFTWG